MGKKLMKMPARKSQGDLLYDQITSVLGKNVGWTLAYESGSHTQFLMPPITDEIDPDALLQRAVKFLLDGMHAHAMVLAKAIIDDSHKVNVDDYWKVLHKMLDDCLDNYYLAKRGTTVTKQDSQRESLPN